MFVNEIRLTKTLPCIAEEGTLQVHALASVELTPLLPYLNTLFKKTKYDNANGSLTFIIDHKISVFIQEDRLVLRKITNTTAAYEMLDRLKDLLNHTYASREEIEPTCEQKKVVSIMDFYRLLPKTNCKQCGVPTCMAFANQLYQEENAVDACPLLKEEKYKENMERIHALL